ncbi:HTH-type transcriptional regulator ArgP [Caballeronia sp. 15711]|uniref:HTH-type transcriptional regulator ArgP n=1 Tax=Caballeronia sp. 15711 TaxID=3391029 RepID=UPI0039E3994C
MLFDRQQLETFAMVLEMRNFGVAAQALNVTRGAVSQRIIALEEALGTPLIVREGSIPTPAGEALLRHIQALKLMEADTLQQIKPGTSTRAKIAIAVNADSLATWFGPVACAIAMNQCSLELVVDDQNFTLAVLTRGEAMGCVSAESRAPTGFVAEAIGAMEYQCVAAPAFCQKYFPRGINLHDILAAPAVLFNRKDGIHAEFIQRLLGFPVSGYTAHYFPSPVALLMAVRAGVGYGLVPCMQTRSLVEAGDLVALAPEDPVSVELYWHHWAKAPPNARAISETVIQHARQSLNQSSQISAGKPARDKIPK